MRIAPLALFGLLPVTGASVLAQSAALPTRIVTVAGGDMRVWTEGLDQRQPGRPVVILEAGAGNGLETWRPVFADIAKLGPVVAYDRRGIGQSQQDSERPTLRRVAASLHALLAQLDAAPPYVLVGHSWGGAYVRAFGDVHPGDVAGMVFVDASDIETSRPEKVAVLPEADRAKVLAAPTLPPFELTPGQRAEYEEIIAENVSDYAIARTFRQPPGIPVAVVISTPPERLAGNGAALVRLNMRKQADWALTSSKGLFITAAHVGHDVHRDDPGLVMLLIQHTLKYAK
jgi:pimeloyl-ACP methyl ester carboxylesterase